MGLTELIIWFSMSLVALLFLQGWIERYAMAACLLLARDNDIGLSIYTFLFFPGLVLHEASHWVVARMLAVPVYEFSVRPTRLRNGRIRMGYVATGGTNFVFESLIGAAPVLVGSVVVVWMSKSLLRLDAVGAALATGQMSQVIPAVQAVLNTPDVWLWIYVVFTVSNFMLPSGADRRAWPWLLVTALAIGLLFYLMGIGAILVPVLLPLTRWVIEGLATAFTITAALDLLAAGPLYYLVQRLEEWTGQRVEQA